MRNRLVPLAILLGFVALLVFVYRYTIFGDWKLSFTNVQYSFPPFSSLGVAIKGPLLSDPADNVLPIAWATYHTGIFSTWLYNFGLGGPQLMSLYLAPLNWLYALPFDVVQPLISVIKFSASFTGAYLFIKRITGSRAGAFIGAVSFTFSSALVMWHGWPHSEVSMYAPFLFLMLDLMLEKIRVRYCVGIALFAYLMLTPGMPTYAAYFFYLAICYGAVFCIKRYRKEPKRIVLYLGACLVSGIIGVVMSLPYTGELLTTVGSNGYASSRSSQAAASLGLSQIKTMLLPYVPTSTTLHPNEATVFTGVLAVLSVALTPLHGKSKKRVGFFFVSSAVLFLLVFTGILTPLYEHLPLINTSLKTRVIVLMNFTLSMLLGINIGDLLSSKLESKSEKAYALAGTIIPFIAFLVLVRYDASMFERVVNPQTLQFLKRETLIGGLLGVLLCAVVICRIVRPTRMITIGCGLALMLGVSLDMGYFASHYLPLIEKDASTIPAETATVVYLQEHTQDGSKYAAVGNTWTLFPSSNMFYGIRDVRGHGLVFTNEDLTSYYSAVGELSATATRPSWEDIDNVDLLRYMGVRYLVYTVDDLNKQGLEAVYDPSQYEALEDGMVIVFLGDYAPQVELIQDVHIEEDDDAVLDAMEQGFEPNTLFLSQEKLSGDIDVSQAASLDSDEGVSDVIQNADGSMSFTTNVNENRFVLINEYFDDGWKAYVDGEEVSIVKGNYLFRAIEVPAGSHKVELKYESQHMKVFFIAAAGSAGALVVIACFSKRVNRCLMDYDAENSTMDNRDHLVETRPDSDCGASARA